MLAAKQSESKTSEAKAKRATPADGEHDVLQTNPTWQALALGRLGVQTKLTVSQPDDPYEREADQVADRVMRMTEPQPDNTTLLSTLTNKRNLQRKCSPCEEDEEHRQLRRKPDDRTVGSVNDEPSMMKDMWTSRGQSLDASTRSFMEHRFGYDLSEIRVHTDARAAESAAAMNALAYTVGNHIAFAANQYATATTTGRTLLAHELTHAIQQQRAPINPRRVEAAESPAEQEAHATASAVTQGREVSSITGRPTGISRDVGWAQRGPIPDPYGMGYNQIFASAGIAATQAIYDLASLERLDMSVDLALFSALPAIRALEVLNLQSHASGTAVEPWFPLMRAQLQTQTMAVADPYGGPTTVTAYFIPGRTDRRALIIGGVHQATEPQGSVVVDRLRVLLTSRSAAGHPPFFTTVLVPSLFAAARYSSSNPRWITGGMGRDISGTLQTSRAVEPNRNFPLPGEDLAAAQARGAGGPNQAELMFRNPAHPSAAPAESHDTSGAGHAGTSIRMLPETRTLISLIEHFHPERIASVHAHSLKSIPGDAPGIFVDPRGVDPATGAVTNAAQAAEDDRLATAMVREGRTRLASAPITGVRSPNPFIGNRPGTSQSTVRYASGAHAEGSSLGMWAPTPVTSGPGTRAGITTMTIEVPQWNRPSEATELSRIEDLDRDLLGDIFLEDPAAATPATGPVTP